MNAYLESIKREIKDCGDLEVLRYLANDLADEQLELRKRIEELLNDRELAKKTGEPVCSSNL